MDELNKLIEQYERENPGKKACVQKRVYQGNSIASEDIYSKAFVNYIITSRPTCGVEQRKFLDEVEKLRPINDGAHYVDSENRVKLFCDSFTADLQKVIQGE